MTNKVFSYANVYKPLANLIIYVYQQLIDSRYLFVLSPV